MKAPARWCLIGCALVLLGACGRPLAPAGQTLSAPRPPAAEEFRQKALNHEKQGELPEALFAWRVVALLEPDNSLTPGIIETLQHTIAKAAQTHFESGQTHYRAGRYEEAARDFLVTLRLTPGHRRAAYYLKQRIYRRPTVSYVVRPGDSFSRIALYAYGDAGLGDVIACYNDLDARKPLVIGRTLRLPALERSGTPPRSDPHDRELLESAAQALAQRRYDAVLDITTRMASGTAYSPHALRLRDEARFQWGLELSEQQRYLAALEQFKQVGEGFSGRNEAIAKARKRLQHEDTAARLAAAAALMHQKAHVGAINALEEILSREPGHAEAATMLQSARYAFGRSLLEAQREDQALQILSALDPGYQDTAQWIALARARVTARAEALYRKGVKFFLAEELEMAVECWEQTLALNPDHSKARQDIDNALRLLDRWRGLKKE